ncbi:hypothetical protein [Chryseobacterium carnipullorum]|uniref:hypothetical protein n=1 Tax=Chryseobacterium carnipullorum TaxID=1124835 RepID=UPI000E97EE1F|nr:hypothetical protein [Chryseobacterium carnipullorum]HBV16095.1 hypothetical protein [Chryseobacterium carnipullorum]
MSKFIVYIELHNGIKEDYEKLDFHLKEKGFSKDTTDYGNEGIGEKSSYSVSYIYNNDDILEKIEMISKVKKILTNVNKMYRNITVTKNNDDPLEFVNTSMF